MDDHQVRCCRGVADLRPPERFPPESITASAATFTAHIFPQALSRVISIPAMTRHAAGERQRIQARAPTTIRPAVLGGHTAPRVVASSRSLGSRALGYRTT